jgi:hypothetical protein
MLLEAGVFLVSMKLIIMSHKRKTWSAGWMKSILPCWLTIQDRGRGPSRRRNRTRATSFLRAASGGGTRATAGCRR